MKGIGQDQEVLNQSNIIYIVDMVRGQWGPDGVENTIIQTAKMDGGSVGIRLPQDQDKQVKHKLRLNYKAQRI